MKRKFYFLPIFVIALLGLFLFSACEEELKRQDGDEEIIQPGTGDFHQNDCVHNFEHTVILSPDCTNEGEEELICTVCGYRTSRTIKELGHKWGEWEISIPSTCTEAGEEKRICETCGDSEIRYLALLDHEWGEWKRIYEPSCLQGGLEERVCSLCQEEETRWLEQLEHEWTEWETQKEPTCIKRGERTRYCLRGNHGDFEYIEPLGHLLPEDRKIIHESTCNYAGQYAKKCERCGDLVDIEYLPLKEHDFEQGVCKLCGRHDWTVAQIDDPDLYASEFGFRSFSDLKNGAIMQQFYLQIDEAARKYHESQNMDEILCEFALKETGLSPDEAAAVWKTYLDDHPLYYWMGRELKVEEKITVFVDGAYTDPQTRHDTNELIYQKAAKWREEASDNAYLATLAYHDFIIKAVDYSQAGKENPESNQWTHNIVGVFEEKGAVCEGYARSFQLLLNMTGIENIFVTGKTKKESHAWNLVRLDDGEWYWYDLTFDDNPSRMWGIHYNYFAVDENADTQWEDGGLITPKAVFSENHTPDNGVGVHYLGELPERAKEPYQGGGELLVRETFSEGPDEFAVAGYQTVQLVKSSRSGDVEIPETVSHNGVQYTVISVGIISYGIFEDTAESVFGFNTVITKLSIPSTIQFIWQSSFFSDIAAFEVSKENEYFTARDGVLFTKNLYTLINYPNLKASEEYVIPDEVRILAYGMFTGSNDFLRKLTVGRNVECWGVPNWGKRWPDATPRGVIYIVDGFWGDLWLVPNLEEMKVDPMNRELVVENGSILSKERDYYYACLPNETEVIIPATVKYIGSSAFYCRGSLKRIVFGNAVKQIGSIVFGNCGVEEIIFPGTREEWEAIDKGEYNEDRLSRVTVTCLK